MPGKRQEGKLPSLQDCYDNFTIKEAMSSARKFIDESLTQSRAEDDGGPQDGKTAPTRRVIKSVHDIEHVEFKKCHEIVTSALKVDSEDYRVTVDLMDEFFEAVFDGWHSDKQTVGMELPPQRRRSVWHSGPVGTIYLKGARRTSAPCRHDPAPTYDRTF